MERAQTNFNFQDFMEYKERWQEALRIAYAFQIGYDSLYYRQQKRWSENVTGSLTSTDWYGEDGILPVPTQAPTFFDKSDNITHRLKAQGANHLEQTAHPSVRDRLEEAFGNPDVDIPEVGEGDDPLSVTVNGVPYINDGQATSFSAGVSNADGAVSYQWYYRQETYSSWTPGGTGSTFQHTFYSAPGGETAHSAVKVEVTSTGETASDVHSVDVYGDANCQNGLNAQSAESDSVGTNAIIPCN